MEIEDINRVLHKLDIQESDIVQMSETHSFSIPHDHRIRKVHKTYEVTTKDGVKHYLKMHQFTKDIRKKGEIGYDLMVD